MELLSGVGLDVAAVAIVGYCTMAAARKGFLRTVIQMIAYVAILMIASFFSRAAAPVIYDHVVIPMLLQNADRSQSAPAPSASSESALDDLLSSLRGEESEEEDPREVRSNATLVSVVPHGMPVGMGDDSLDRLLAGGTDALEGLLPEGINPEEIAGDFVEDLADATLRPLMINAISMVSFVVVFAVLSLVGNILLSTLGIINHLPIVGPVNAMLGGIVGVLQGLLLVWVLAVFLQGLLHLYPEGWWIFTAQSIDQSFLFQYFANPTLLKGLGV